MQENYKNIFIEKANKIHDNKYNYSLVEYTNNIKKIKIVYPIHGIFEQTPREHLKNIISCIKCHNEEKIRLFIEKANKIHNNKYDYSHIKKLSAYEKIKIICTKHGIFRQEYNSHLKGYGCGKCSGTYKTQFDFIKQSKKIFINENYDYSLVNYINNKKKIKVLCPEHGSFEEFPINFLKGNGCKKCALASRTEKYEQLFINNANKIHNNKYDYSLVNYLYNKKKINIICKKHGVFEQIPNSHLSGAGCPKCYSSRGEKKIISFFNENNITYFYQKTFNDCKDIRKLQFDFYLPEQNAIIEYNGIQHYEPIKYFGGIESLKSQQKRDNIKTNYCIENNINLIRIRYNENIEDKLIPIIKNKFETINI